MCAGSTGHAEVIQVTYDPGQVDFTTLLEVFWKTHDPTTLNRQGADVGTQYRSAIFFHTEEQRRLAEEYKAKLDASGAFNDPIVTEITAYKNFFPAETYHQDFFAQNQGHPYCRAVIVPKVDKFRKVFADRLKGAEPSAAGSPQAGPADESDDAADDAGGLPADTDWSKVDWQSRLTKEQYKVTRKAGTERPFKNEYWDNKRDGVYRCVCCAQPLFDSDAKYESGTGWPSFWAPVAEGSVSEHEDRSWFSVRTEIRCSRCDAHLGHVFSDGPEPTGQRYCMNSAAMRFEQEAAEQASAETEKPADTEVAKP